VLVYANEIDRVACEWLRSLPIRIDRIDDRSIADVSGADLDGFTQCHFFAGIAGWPLALQMAGWPDDAPVWTGSCPCQPFSVAGKRKGHSDERHLWPEFLRLIAECRPATVFGEQVASKAGREWLAVVRADLEALGYAVGAADLCAAGIGAPHIRQRLFWVADAESARGRANAETVRSGKAKRIRGSQGQDIGRTSEQARRAVDRRSVVRLGYTESDGRQQGRAESNGRDASAANGRMGDAASERCGKERKPNVQTGPANLFTHSGWSDVDYIPCRDGKARPVKPGVRLLASGVSGRVAQLRGLGNAIVPQIAAEFVAAFMETR